MRVHQVSEIGFQAAVLSNEARKVRTDGSLPKVIDCVNSSDCYCFVVLVGRANRPRIVS